MEKTLYWIDDSAADMSQIMEQVFPLVWNKGGACKIILFGNGYCSQMTEHGPEEKDRERFENELQGFFRYYCAGIDDSEWRHPGETFKEKQKQLLPDSVSLVPMDFLKGESDDVTDYFWMNEEKLKEEKSLDDPEASIDRLIEKMRIPPNAIVALDICLLYGDFQRIQEKEPCISMALYKKLKENNDCFLYSGMSVTKPILDNWKSIYGQRFEEACEPEIYAKNELTTKQEDTDAKNALIALFKEKEGRT